MPKSVKCQSLTAETKETSKLTLMERKLAMCLICDKMNEAKKEQIMSAKADKVNALFFIPLRQAPVSYAPDSLKADKAFMLGAANSPSSCFVLKYASKELKADKDLVMATQRLPSLMFKNGDSLTKADVLTSWRAGSLKGASDELKADKEVIQLAVESHGSALAHASDALKADKQIVLIAMNNGGSLRDVSKALCANERVVLAALKNGELYAGCFAPASEDIRADKEIALIAVKRECTNILYVSDDLKADKDVIMSALENWDNDRPFTDCKLPFPTHLKNDKEVIMAIVKEDGDQFEFASDELKADKEVAVAAMSCDWADVLKFASVALQADPELQALNNTALR